MGILYCVRLLHDEANTYVSNMTITQLEVNQQHSIYETYFLQVFVSISSVNIFELTILLILSFQLLLLL